MGQERQAHLLAGVLLLSSLVWAAPPREEGGNRNAKFIFTFMDLVDSFVPSFKRKAPEAQSFVELKKIKEPTNVQNIQGEDRKKEGKFEYFHDQEASLDKYIVSKASRSEDIGFVSSLKIVPMVVKKSQYDEASEMVIPIVNKIRHKLREGQSPRFVTKKPESPVATTEQSYKKIYQNNLRQRIKNLYKDEKKKEESYNTSVKTHKLNNAKKNNTIMSKKSSIFKKNEKKIPMKRKLKINTNNQNGIKIDDNDYDVVSNDYINDLKAMASEKNINTESQGWKPSHKKTKKTEINEMSDLTPSSSYNQMKFWRNQFESDRIKTFVSGKKQTAKKENNPPSRKLQRKRDPFLNTKDTKQEGIKEVSIVPKEFIKKTIQADHWKPLKKLPNFLEIPNIGSIPKEHNENFILNNFPIPLKPSFGVKYRRKIQKKRKKSGPSRDKYIPIPFLDITNITDIPNIEKAFTVGDIENNLARPIIVIPNNPAATERIEILPTPLNPVEDEKVMYKSKITWLDSSIDIKEITKAVTKDINDLKKD